MGLRFNANWNERAIPWHCRLQTRVIVGVLLIFVVVFGVTAHFMIEYEQELVEKQRINISKQLGDVLTNTLSAEMMKGNPESKKKDEVWTRVEELTDKMRDASGALRIQVLSQEGEVLVGTDYALESHQYDKEADPECAACHVHGATEFPSIVLNQQGERSVMRTITPIEKKRECNECHEDDETNFLGMISIDFDYTPIQMENEQKRMRFFLLVLLTGALLFFGIYVMIRRQVLTPLDTLMDASRHLARGQYDARLEIRGENEISRLGETFNHVASEIQKAHEILAVESENNYQSAITDGLTGFRNKVYGEEALNEAVANSQECDEPLGVLMVDLDHFKRINDTHGHLAGDRVLRETARLIRQLLHYSDVPVRYGGEEFMIILANTDHAGLETVGERLRTKIEQNSFVIDDDGTAIQVTTSVGGTLCRKDDKQIEQIIERADNALYQAKGGGRNRLVVVVMDE